MDSTDPTHRESIGTHPGTRRSSSPIEIHFRINPFQCQLLKVETVEILTLQSGNAGVGTGFIELAEEGDQVVQFGRRQGYAGVRGDGCVQGGSRPVVQIGSGVPESAQGRSIQSGEGVAQTLTARGLECSDIMKHSQSAVRVVSAGMAGRTVFLHKD